jgi:hypothetical protein|tara:strand:+ start:121 stop:552 length:432 start_codon:yes stop_codon:yes gene_type:complete
MIIGFHFTKILIEQQNQLKGKVGISNGVDITNITEQKYSLKNKQKALTFQFTFTVDYKKDIGNITLNGDVMYLLNEKRYKQVLDLWKKNKKIPPEESMIILNRVLHKCNIKALELSQELNLPPHIPLPKVNFETQSLAESYIG